MKTTRERLEERLVTIARRIDMYRTANYQLQQHHLDDWGDLIAQRDRTQGQLNRIDGGI